MLRCRQTGAVLYPDMEIVPVEELKEYAQEELGDKFNEVEFHKVILDAGPCQFYILEDLVKEYVKENK